MMSKPKNKAPTAILLGAMLALSVIIFISVWATLHNPDGESATRGWPGSKPCICQCKCEPCPLVKE
jgi:hypothetical protein